MEQYEREERWIHPLPASYIEPKATHIRLVKGIVKYNPHVVVLCPVLAGGGTCERGVQRKKEDWYRPKLLVRNCGDPTLQLWCCEGCEDKFLLRVKME